MLSTLFYLLLPNVTNSLCLFFLFRFVFNNVFTIFAVIENEKLKLALSIPIGAPVTVANDAIDIPLLVEENTCKGFSK